MSLADFRTSYPYCTLITELLLYEQGQYVVRCQVEQAGQPIASGMSAANTVEQAEDQARDRALALLAQVGVPPLSHAGAIAISSPAVPAGKVSALASPASPLTAAPTPVPPVAQDLPSVSTSFTAEGLPSSPTALPESEPESEPELMLPRPSTANLPQPKVTANGAIDFSDVIARTNLELKRLGWTNEQGRDYLLQTYGKRSRQLLEDHELLEFLAYLEAQ